jgi:hypothetical protein
MKGKIKDEGGGELKKMEGRGRCEGKKIKQ